MPGPIRAVFLGTPEFAVSSLKALIENPELVHVVAVYTQPDRPAGRGQKVQPTPVKALAELHHIPIFQPSNINLPEQKRQFADLMADIAIVVAYAQFLSPGILNTPRLGCVNVHASLLPKYRGASPIQAAILNGETETGITTIRLVPEMDAGPTIVQKSLTIGSEETAGQLSVRLAALGAEVLLETLEQINSRAATEKPQDETGVTFARKISKEDGKIDWRRPGLFILRQIRAFNPWPGTFVTSSKGTLKIHAARFHAEGHGSGMGAPQGATPGEAFSGTGGLWVRCGDGWIEILKVQPEGKREMAIQDFLNGVKQVSDLNLR